jgi:hypothetical protein
VLTEFLDKVSDAICLWGESVESKSLNFEEMRLRLKERYQFNEYDVEVLLASLLCKSRVTVYEETIGYTPVKIIIFGQADMGRIAEISLQHTIDYMDTRVDELDQ